MVTPTPSMVVVGDALLDIDLLGRVERLCPDAPVPAVTTVRRDLRPGGAALTAALAAAAGAHVRLVTAVSGWSGRAIVEALAQRGVEVVDLGRTQSSPVKQRVVVDSRSLLRIDDHDEAEEPTPDAGAIDRLRSLLADASVIVASDYGRGVLRASAVRAELAAARCPTLWDPHPAGPPPVRGCTILTPNERELTEADGADGDLGTTIASAVRMQARAACGVVAVTRGARGALTVDGSGTATVIAPPPDDRSPAVVDPCGAGDALVASAAEALAHGALPIEAVATGVERASAFVRAGGVRAWWSPAPQDRACDPPDPPTGPRPRTVATSGCFDLLHPGHVAVLEGARRLGDRLVVLVNSDRSVRRLKGPARPIQNERDRAAVLRSLAAVDEVVIFDQDTPEAALAALAPDVYVKGGDYGRGELPEAEVVARSGGAIVVLPYVGDRSTSRLIRRAIDGQRSRPERPTPVR